MNCLNTLTNVLVRLYHFTIIKEDLHLHKHTINPEMQAYSISVNFLLHALIPNFGLKFLRIWSRFHLSHFENNTEMRCSWQYASWFFIRMLVPLFCTFVCSVSFCIAPFTLTSAHPTLPVENWAFPGAQCLFPVSPPPWYRNNFSFFDILPDLCGRIILQCACEQVRPHCAFPLSYSRACRGSWNLGMHELMPGARNASLKVRTKVRLLK